MCVCVCVCTCIIVGVHACVGVCTLILQDSNSLSLSCRKSHTFTATLHHVKAEVTETSKNLPHSSTHNKMPVPDLEWEVEASVQAGPLGVTVNGKHDCTM